MRHSMTIAAAALAVLFSVAPAKAGPAGEALSQCLVTSASEADKTAMARWIFVFFITSPSLADLGPIAKDKTDAVNQKMAEVYERLLFESCYPQSVAAMKVSEDEFGDALSVLGETSVELLLTAVTDADAVKGIAPYLHMEKWLKLSVDTDVKKE